jgi:hypothetical protein
MGVLFANELHHFFSDQLHLNCPLNENQAATSFIEKNNYAAVY